MEYRFNANEWVQLTPSERIRRCRLLAEQARHLAKNSPNMKQSYLTLADNWLELAAEIERTLRSQ